MFTVASHPAGMRSPAWRKVGARFAQGRRKVGAVQSLSWLAQASIRPSIVEGGPFENIVQRKVAQGWRKVMRKGGVSSNAVYNDVF